jgi:hypothetical protein
MRSRDRIFSHDEGPGSAVIDRRAIKEAPSGIKKLLIRDALEIWICQKKGHPPFPSMTTKPGKLKDVPSILKQSREIFWSRSRSYLNPQAQQVGDLLH